MVCGVGVCGCCVRTHVVNLLPAHEEYAMDAFLWRWGRGGGCNRES